MNRQELHHLIERYFDGSTSLTEERILRNELANTPFDTLLIREAKAVIGYAISSPTSRAFKRQPSGLSRRYRSAVATILLVICSATGIKYLASDRYIQYESYAYIDGVKVTDSAVLDHLFIESVESMIDAATDAASETDDDIKLIISAMTDNI